MLNMRSLRGKLEVDDLRNLFQIIPTTQEPTPEPQAGVGYRLYWDYAINEYPKIHMVQPYISWSDTIMLKPGSTLTIYGVEVPVNMAVIHGTTLNHLRAIQKRAMKSVTNDQARQAMPDEDEIMFSVNKKDDLINDSDPVFAHLNRQVFKIVSSKQS